MTLTSPPNHLHTLDEQDAVQQRYLRRITPVVGYIVLLLLMLYVLYSSQVPVPVSKGKPVKKPWSISQGFFYVGCHQKTGMPGARLSEPARAKPGCIGTGACSPRRLIRIFPRRPLEAIGYACVARIVCYYICVA
jgi:hypothetical protein